jgi:Na+/H+-dicarboxylate symporter
MRTRRALLWTAAALALGLTFAAYLNPHLAVSLANQLWSCF